MSDHKCFRCPECGSCPACAADALDRVIEEAENLRERLDQFDAHGFPNVAAALDRVNAAEARAERAERERDAYRHEWNVSSRQQGAETRARKAAEARAARAESLLTDDGPDGQRVTNAQHVALRERLARAEAALREIAKAEWKAGCGFCHPEGCESPRVARAALAGGEK